MRLYIVKTYLIIVCGKSGSFSRLMKKKHELKYTEHNDRNLLIEDT